MFQNQCPICLQQIEERLSPACCRHVFCAYCINQWLTIKNSCPLCIRNLQEEPRNHLSKAQQDEFDFSSITLDEQIEDTRKKLRQITTMISNKCGSCANRSNFPRAKLDVVKKEMSQAQQKYQEAVTKNIQNDKVGCTLLLQELTEIVLEVQLILNQEVMLEYEQEYDEGQEQDYQYEFMNRIEKSGKRNKKNRV